MRFRLFSYDIPDGCHIFIADGKASSRRIFDGTHVIAAVLHSPKVEVWKDIHTFLKMNFDSKEVWIHLHHLHPIAEPKYIFWKMRSSCISVA